jgi:hypothetical protein
VRRLGRGQFRLTRRLLHFLGSAEELDAPLAGGRANPARGVAAGFAEGAAVGSALGTLLAGRDAGGGVVDDDAFEAAGAVDEGTVGNGGGSRGRGCGGEEGVSEEEEEEGEWAHGGVLDEFEI